MRLSNIALAISAQYGGLFTPSSLFTAGINGAWYDPSDFGTMFQDAAGTTPVTAVEQPVGLMLDNSKGLVLGPELVAFTSNPASYTFSNTTGASVGGSLEVTKTASNGLCAISLSTSVGKFYKITVPVRKGTLTDNAFRLLSSGAYLTGFHNNASPDKTAGSLTLFFTATSTTSWVYVQHYGAQLGTFYVDNISVREFPGNHAFNSSGNSANFPVLSARYNLLTKTEDFSDAAWVKTNLTATANKLTSANLTGIQAVDSTSATYPAGVYIFSLKVKSDGWRWVQLRTNVSLSSSYVNFDVISGVKGTESGAIGSITDLGANEYLISISLTFLSASGAVAIQLVDSGTAARNPSVTGNGVSGIFVRDADILVANDALNQPAYQRVNTATDYDTVGFKPYLKFNGVNQWLQTNSIDFTYGDKMFVSAGVRKLSDAAVGVVAELSASILSNNGTFGLFAPASVSTNMQFASKGTTINSLTVDSVAAPITAILTGQSNIAAPKLAFSVNTVAATPSTATQGAGNYGNCPLYIGARAGSSLWFNGRLYGLVVAGKQASASEIASTEVWLNQKTGAY